MGYYTNFFLSAKGYPEPLPEEKAKLLAEDIKGATDLEYVNYHHSPVDGGYHVEADAEAKWYDCENDMYELSRRWPEVLFDLRGDGEETEDLWEQYWLNGEVQRNGIEIKWNPFERRKLKPYRSTGK